LRRQAFHFGRDLDANLRRDGFAVDDACAHGVSLARI
jgi:hypothetical protein